MVAPKYFRTQLTRGGPVVGLKIWRDHPRDPLTDELLVERPVLWRAQINGIDVPIEDVAPQFLDGTGDTVRGDECDETEYNDLSSMAGWDRDYDPNAPAANPRKKVDLNKLAPIKW